MIERYSLPKMSSIWQDEFKFKTMLHIELLALEALAKKGKVPHDSVRRIKKKAKFDLEKIKKIEEKTHHDVVAFVNCVAQYLGSDAKYLHAGLTSSDVLDTTLGVQLKESCDILIQDMNRLYSDLPPMQMGECFEEATIPVTVRLLPSELLLGSTLLVRLEHYKRLDRLDNRRRSREARHTASHRTHPENAPDSEQ